MNTLQSDVSFSKSHERSLVFSYRLQEARCKQCMCQLAKLNIKYCASLVTLDSNTADMRRLFLFL